MNSLSSAAKRLAPVAISAGHVPGAVIAAAVAAAVDTNVVATKVSAGLAATASFVSALAMLYGMYMNVGVECIEGFGIGAATGSDYRTVATLETPEVGRGFGYWYGLGM
jgi:hypothetical protein